MAKGEPPLSVQSFNKRLLSFFTLPRSRLDILDIFNLQESCVNFVLYSDLVFIIAEVLQIDINLEFYRVVINFISFIIFPNI